MTSNCCGDNMTSHSLFVRSTFWSSGIASSFARICATSTLLGCAREHAESAMQTLTPNKNWTVRSISYKQLRFQPTTCRLDRRSVLARFNPSGKGGRLIGLSIARKQNRPRPKVALIRHLTLRQLQYDEIVTQFAAAVFAAFHVRFEIVSEQCDVQRQRPRLHGVRSESGADLPIIAY